MIAICHNCVTNPWLISEIKNYGSPTVLCECCGASDSLFLRLTDHCLRSIFRIIIRINYSEREYNEVMGGTYFRDFFTKNYIALGLNPSIEFQKLLQIASVIEDQDYLGDREFIPIHGREHGYLISLRSRIHSDVDLFANDCIMKNYFQMRDDFHLIMNKLRTIITTTIPAGSKFFRARIGTRSKREGFEISFGHVGPTLYSPYSAQTIGAPPLSSANEGRLNRAKIAVLYAATDRHTALCEIRPHPGHMVSIAEFSSTQNLKSANFVYPSIEYALRTGDLESLHMVISIGELLSAPVPPEEKNLYLVTQMLGDMVREAGFDAIEFQSSVGEGANVVIFDSKLCEFIPGSERVERVDSVRYVSTEVPIDTPENIDRYHRD